MPFWDFFGLPCRLHSFFLTANVNKIAQNILGDRQQTSV